jgi:single-stranded DNA-binding protein
MNSCILMANVIQDPQLRYTPDNQTPIAEMLVQFPGLRETDPPATLKVIGWGNLAQDIHQQYHVGDRLIIEGRLNMNTVERPEGIKEKRAELTAQRIYRLGAGENVTVTAAATAAATASSSSSRVSTAPPRSTASEPSTGSYGAPSAAPENFDDIPF